MYSRVVEANVKPEKRNEFLRVLDSELIPVLQRQPGYVDMVRLSSETNPNTGVGVVFWQSRADAEHFYNTDEFRRVQQRMLPYLQQEPRVRTYNVENSTYHHIAAGRAA